jgi:hypothetical protein
MGSSCYSDVRLTLKRLTLLGYTPASVLDDKDKGTLISIAKSVVSKAAEQSVTDVFRAAALCEKNRLCWCVCQAWHVTIRVKVPEPGVRGA